MGFLFFKKKEGKKKEDMPSLDMPGPPPISSSDDVYRELPSLPGAEKDGAVLPHLEPFGAAKEKSKSDILPPIIPEAPASKGIDLPTPKPSVPVFPEIKSEADLGPMFKEPEKIDTPLYEDFVSEKPEPALSIPEPIVSSLNQPFVKAQNFRTILESINLAVNSGRETTKKVTEIHRIESDKEQKETQWHLAVEAMQRKLVLIDKTLFE